ncbi:D-glycero-beta-D-manno-heptose-7-phosphate kinase [Candidatus Woesearchaeota archaeon]|nr:D-glycero-beta-D-manno-heptose-7-phosphate kinase [Candidatus Woesearchaeota archaeon]
MKGQLLGLIEKFKGKKILVIGDIMLDKYLKGDVSRISPEAPVPIVTVTGERFVPGGAANVASNIASLGGNVRMAGVIGNDDPGELLIKELQRRGVGTDSVIIDKKKPTTQKVRIVAQNQQLLRVDYEDTAYIAPATENELIRSIQSSIPDSDAIVVSDYAKGAITSELMRSIHTARNNQYLIVDPKPKHKALYAGVSIITPNLKEAREMAHAHDEPGVLGKQLVGELQSTILITLGDKGMALFEQNGNITEIPTKAKEVFDVSGAGDTVVAALALALAAGADFVQAAFLANHAAGVVVGKVGTAVCSIEELQGSIDRG